MSDPQSRHRGPIDWADVRVRLKRAEDAMEQALHPTPERAKAIMDARAQALARPPYEAPSGARVNVVVFSLGRERYAIETAFLREVIRLADVTPVLGTPEFVIGVTNLRGSVLVIADLRPFLNITSTGDGDASRVIVLGKERIEFGILADQIHGHADLAVDDIEATARSAASEGTFIRGVTRDALIVLDGAALLEDQRLSVGEDALVGAIAKGE